LIIMCSCWFFSWCDCDCFFVLFNLCCIVLYCIVLLWLYFIVLYCVVLYCNVFVFVCVCLIVYCSDHVTEIGGLDRPFITKAEIRELFFPFPK
jgi:hypothetical protein